MNLSICAGSLAIFCSLVSVSCGDDPALVEKREKQKAQIAALRGDLALVEEKLKNLPPDVSEKLAEAKTTSLEQNAELQKLEAEVAGLEERKRRLQGEFEAYQRKYQVQ
jgi:chromosome segregation ATPase